MTVTRPSSGALIEARALLRSLSLARQSFALYQTGHPTRRHVLTEVSASIRRLQEFTPGNVVVFAGRGGFYLGPTLLPRASLAYHSLLRSFDDAGIEAVEFRRGVTEEGLEALMEILTAEFREHVELPPEWGVALNRIRPVPGTDRDRSGVGEMLRSYAAGLDFMRDAASRVGAGDPADIQAAGRLTDRLADQVIANPSEALLLTTVKSYDEYTYYHMVNVCILSLAIGQAIGLDRDRVVALGMGGLLHDVGKITVPREILQQDGPLTEEQWRIVQRHPVDGVGLLASSARDLHHPAFPMILEHHVGYDRSGYPSLEGRAPSVPARIVAVADCFDALTSKRQYRRPEERRQALNIIQAAAGGGYDPRVVRIFVRLLGLFPIGSLVRLTTGETGVVVRNHDQLLARPVVRLLLDGSGQPSELQEEVDLSEQASDGGFRWSVGRIVGPGEVDVDMLAFLSSGQLEPTLQQEDGPGLVHEPAHGERPPAGYVEADGKDERLEELGSPAG